MMKKAWVLGVAVALAGCARAPERSQDLDAPPPSDEERLREVLEASEKAPTPWSPAVTIPLYPVLFVADTTVKFVAATARYIQALILGAPAELPPAPERLERQAEQLHRK
jgi:hypothetical protein